MSQYLYNASVPLFRYLFTHATEQWEYSELGATHAVELAYVWDQPSLYNTTFSQKELKLVATIDNYWVNFLRFADPNGMRLLIGKDII